MSTALRVRSVCARAPMLLLAVIALVMGVLPRPLAADSAQGTRALLSECEDRTQGLRYQGDFAGALAAVDGCLEQAPERPELLLLRAGVLHAKDDLEGALEAYREALAAGLYGPSRRKVRKIIRDLAPVARTQLRIEVENGPAEVYVLAKALGVRCVADPVCTLGRLPGRVRVYIERPGFEPLRERVEIVRNETTELIRTLEELPSPVEVELVPGDAEVMIDGAPWQPGEEASMIAAGEHRLEVSRRGFAPHEQVIVAQRGEPVQVRVELVELLGVRVVPAGAQVVVNGQVADVEDGVVEVAHGQAVRISASADGYFDKTVDVPAKRPYEHTLAIELEAVPPPPPPPPVEWTPLKIAAVGSAGLVALSGYGAAGYLSSRASRQWSDAAAYCRMDEGVRTVCAEEGVALGTRARASAFHASLAMAAGATATTGLLWALQLNEQPPEHGGLSLRRKVSLGAAAGVFAAGVGMGVFYGMRARSQYGQADAHCAEGLGCDAQGLAAQTAAQDSARTSNLGFVVAGAAAVAATGMWMTAPSRPRDEEPAAGARSKSAGVRVLPLITKGSIGASLTRSLP